MRIIHFSDIHVGRAAMGRGAWFDKRLLGRLNYLLRRHRQIDERRIASLVDFCRASRPDLAVCSGDLTCVGSPAEFAAAVDALSPLLDLPGTEFVFVPGNHDAYVDAPICRQALATASAVLGWHPENPSERLTWRTVAGLDLALANLALPTQPCLSSGRLDQAVGEQLDAWLRQGSAPKLLVGHFPTSYADGRPLERRRRLAGAERIAKALDDGRLRAYLCGHIHQPFIRRTPANTIECCAGALTITGRFASLEIAPDGTVTHHWQDLPQQPREGPC